MTNLLRVLLCVSAMLTGFVAAGQSVLTARMQELLRNVQLAHPDSIQSSLMLDALQKPLYKRVEGVELTKGTGRLRLNILPVSLTLQNNSQLPYDWNLGAMVPNKGLQYLGAAGVQLSFKDKWHLQLAPEWVVAQNKDFEIMSQELNPRAWRDYFLYFYNITDIPERMGGSKFHRFHLGQSSLRYSGTNFTYALSTANKWWGPGYRNALVMSSNAPGFLHLSATTKKPLRTRWGLIEGEAIAGLLESSGQRPPRSYTAFEGAFVYPQKNNERRYLTGFTANWQPKWIRGLYLGIAKASYLYPSDISSPLDVLPLQGFFGKKVGKAEKNNTKASLGSLYMRYVLAEEKAELYFEYGRKDAALLPWTVWAHRPYRSGYTGGFKKLLPIGLKDQYIQLGAEITQLQAPDAQQVMQPQSWYTHTHVLQGYTHLGKPLGAGIGPGSNSQTFDIHWIKDAKRIGVQLERVKHNADYYYAAFENLGDFRRHWVTLGTTLKGDWDFRHLSLHGSFGVIRSLNHQWIVVEADGSNYFSAGNEYLNFTSQVSVRYRF